MSGFVNSKTIVSIKLTLEESIVEIAKKLHKFEIQCVIRF